MKSHLFTSYNYHIVTLQGHENSVLKVKVTFHFKCILKMGVNCFDILFSLVKLTCDGHYSLCIKLIQTV